MVNKMIIGTLALMVGSVSLLAQDAGNQVPEKAAEVPQVAKSEVEEDKGSLDFLNELDAQADTVKNADDAARKYLLEKGWIEGLNKTKGIFVTIASAKIEANPADKNFQIRRVIAFEQALQNAKVNISKFYAQEITTRSKLLVVEPNSAAVIAQQMQAEQEAQIPHSVTEKVTALIHANLDEQLAKKGVTYDSPKAEPIIEELLNSKSFMNEVNVLSSTQVGGLVVSKIFEQDGEFTIVAYYSNNTKLLAGAINGTGATPKVKPRNGAPIEEWVLTLKPSQLYSSMGIQLSSDSKGNIVLISYGQSQARSTSGTSVEMAYEKAYLDAVKNIRNFAGEVVVYAAESRKQSESKEYASGEQVSDVEERTQKLIETEAGRLPISGIQKIRQWKITDPRSNSIICGVVCAWSLRTSDSANRSREEMKDATINRGGHMKVAPKAVEFSQPSASQNVESQPLPKTYQNVEKYKNQSVESEDF